MFIAAAIHQIFAFLYSGTDNIAKAEEQFTIAIKLAQSVANKAELSLDYMSLGDLYVQKNKLDIALSIENKALRYALESNYKIYVGYILDAIGDICFTQKKYDLAGDYYRRSLRESIEQLNLRDEVLANLALSRWARKTGKADSSLVYARTALRKVQPLGVAFIRALVYNELFNVFKTRTNQDSAFAYLQLAKSLTDSLHWVELAKTNQYQRLNLTEQMRVQEKEKAKIPVSKSHPNVCTSGWYRGDVIGCLFALSKQSPTKKSKYHS